ncbi:NAD(P)H-binding protein [Actinoplanes sp. NEAU-A12]|uniref:NAD(P)H-binding protein n=1 Tax=Actinoplanes sandaracinus TaxID=3045177 RepID=A0ABT6WWG3_9ACTN|nr:NAD(P)H-binding protein [Actinoplanes sandaracinus]MDI6104055.1 NAD(P)H-binding protein [Actinoplanes sandaracinus]
MGRIVIFGAGGRAGRAAVAEARRRGHRVTAVVRDPRAHGGLATDGVRVVAGDVTDGDSVARAAAGHDAAISAVYDPAAPPALFYTGAARALLAGLGRAEVTRLLVVGLASVLTTEGGTALMDVPGYPQEYRTFYLAHAAGTEVLRTAAGGVDWLVVSPAGDFDHAGSRTGRYRPATADAASLISYADLAVALIDEIDTPRHHRTHLGVEAA